MRFFYLDAGNRNKGLGNEIAEFVKECGADGLCNIYKDDAVSIKAKANPRKSFIVHIGAIIFDIKEIHLVSHDFRAENIEYDYMFLDRTGIDLSRLTTERNEITIEMGFR